MVKPQMSLMPLVVGAAVLLAGFAVLAQDFHEVVTKSGQIDENVVAGGRTVTVDAQVTGDVVSFGETVVIGGQITDDILSIGRNVVISGTIGGDVRVVGFTVTPSAAIGGDLMAAGRTVTVPAETVIGGNVWLVGLDMNLFGKVDGDLHVAARNILLAGNFGGDVELNGESITVASTARILGDFTYRSIDEATIEPGAEILGDTIFIRTEAPHEMVGGVFAGFSAFGLTFLLGLFLLGALLILIFPNTAADPAKRMGRNPWLALGLGCLILIAGPIAMILLGISIIGIPITIMLGASYVIALFIGFLVAAGTLGRLGARLIGRSADISFWTRLAAFAAGLVFLAIVGFIPVLGPLALILATAAGLGALTLQVRKAKQPAAE